jgi:hypothetical protein
MKQIYYTQCPIGYGLGASNGFQIKRLSPGYPVSGDFRHLGLRAFVAGTRTLAPPTLRYRRGEGDIAEVAWLTPRSNEYETERGLWGRPGGHFAHGLQLDDAEMKAIRDWPAGLYDQPFWTRTDREPTRGQAPETRELAIEALRCPPTFSQVAPLAAGEDTESLAMLLTALASAAGDGRTLYLIDEPGRIADRIALLTFAFPPPWRKDLTFSTYHDRPEELPGFRLQGTIASARPNRPALLAQGIVADLTAGSIEPRIEPGDWARTLAGWLVGRTEADRAAWESIARWSRRIRKPSNGASIWDDEWLARVFRLPALLQGDALVPRSPDEWLDLARMAAWSGLVGLAGEWAEARGPKWWRVAYTEGEEPRVALVHHVGLTETWRDGQAASWGETIGLWLSDCDPAARQTVIAEALEIAPAPARIRFVQALIKALPDAVGRETIPWLKAHPSCEAAVLLPLEARLALGTPETLRAILNQAAASPESLGPVLDAVADEAEGRAEVQELLAEQLAELLMTVHPQAAAEVQNWALRRGDRAEAWLGRYLRRLFVEPVDIDAWRAFQRRTAPDLQPPLARVVLAVAMEPESPERVFRWGVEEVLLPLDEAIRPRDPAWARAYLDRTRSGLDLITRLFSREYRNLGVKRWIDEARKRGELSPEQIDRIKVCESYARALQSGNARALEGIELPAVLPKERGAMLAQILRYVGNGSADALDVVLDTCQEAWPGGFSPGADGLDGLAGPLARELLRDRNDSDHWFSRLSAILYRLGLTTMAEAGFERDSLAAHIIAVSARTEGPGFNPWRFREYLLKNRAWQSLAVDVGRDLRGSTAKESLAALEHWLRLLNKGSYTNRFFELWLNVCDGAQLTAAVGAKLPEFKNFYLSWWATDRYLDARDDLRDAFGRLAPIEPITHDRLADLDAWLFSSRPDEKRSKQGKAISYDPKPLDEAMPTTNPTRNECDWQCVSDLGRTRWHCLQALSEFDRVGAIILGRWGSLMDREPRLDLIESDDRYRFVAWLIALWGGGELDKVPVERLATWLFKKGITDADRVKTRWPEELTGLKEVTRGMIDERKDLVKTLCAELKSVARDAKESARKSR